MPHTNRVDEPTSEKGYKIVGDFAFDEVAPKCKAITPVPGGVGDKGKVVTDVFA